ncbi:Hypothetical_protein [Hexamita inflata]|uniref:Hypothetical_protein n=1 Tax=Hexamita inflata TaxID=28002 RepID=A0AA86P2A4_9EUKA|nr:Hypothetical protein HINF_LOCUS16931 [Hexamita inflata]
MSNNDTQLNQNGPLQPTRCNLYSLQTGYSLFNRNNQMALFSFKNQELVQLIFSYTLFFCNYVHINVYFMGILPSTTDLAEPSQEDECGEERKMQPNESIIDHTKQNQYSSSVSSALASKRRNQSLKSNRSIQIQFNNIKYTSQLNSFLTINN